MTPAHQPSHRFNATAPETPRSRPAWLRWAYVGVEGANSMSQSRKIVVVNVGAMLLLVNIWGLTPLYLLMFPLEAVYPTLWQLPVASASPAVWWLNARGQYHAARWTALLLAVIAVLIAVVMGQGTVMSAHYYFALFALITPTIFERTQWRSMVLMSTLCLGLFGYFSIIGIAPSAAIAAMPVIHQTVAKGLVIVLGVLILMLLVGITEASSAHAEARLTELASTDMLTGLPNRRFFEQSYHQERQRSLRSGSPLFLALIDIDHFKRINDTLGHEAGDDALRYLARLLSAHVRPYDQVARLGGEEFGWLLPQTDAAAALQAAERMRETLAKSTWEYAGQRHTLTASIGVANVTQESDPATALMAADRALYEAKSGGRNQVRLAA